MKSHTNQLSEYAKKLDAAYDTCKKCRKSVLLFSLCSIVILLLGCLLYRWWNSYDYTIIPLDQFTFKIWYVTFGVWTIAILSIMGFFLWAILDLIRSELSLYTISSKLILTYSQLIASFFTNEEYRIVIIVHKGMIKSKFSWSVYRSMHGDEILFDSGSCNCANVGVDDILQTLKYAKSV